MPISFFSIGSSLVEADLALSWALRFWVWSGDSLFKERDRKNSLESERDR